MIETPSDQKLKKGGSRGLFAAWRYNQGGLRKKLNGAAQQREGKANFRDQNFVTTDIIRKKGGLRVTTDIIRKKGGLRSKMPLTPPLPRPHRAVLKVGGFANPLTISNSSGISPHPCATHHNHKGELGN